MKLRRSELRKLENELELNGEAKRNYYNVALGIEALATGIFAYAGDMIASVFMLSTIPTAILSIKRDNKVNFEFQESMAKQARASNEQMDKLSGEDYSYIIRMSERYRNHNITLDDLKVFASLMKRNSLDLLNQRIGPCAYRINKRKIEKALITKSRAKEKEKD